MDLERCKSAEDCTVKILYSSQDECRKGREVLKGMTNKTFHHAVGKCQRTLSLGLDERFIILFTIHDISLPGVLITRRLRAADELSMLKDICIWHSDLHWRISCQRANLGLSRWVELSSTSAVHMNGGPAQAHFQGHTEGPGYKAHNNHIPFL